MSNLSPFERGQMPFAATSEESSGKWDGITIREWLVGLAMQGILAAWRAEREGDSVHNPPIVASRAVSLADAILKELQKEAR